MGGKEERKNFILNRLGQGSFSSQCRGIRYFAFLLKLNDQCSVWFLAFIRPVVQWITRQWIFAPILSPWNARFSLLLVLGKYYAFGQQPSWRVPPYFRQISHTSPLCMRKNLSEMVYWYCRRRRQQHKALKMFKGHNRDTAPRLTKQRDSQMFVLLYTSHWLQKNHHHHATKPKELTSCFSPDSSAHLEKLKKTMCVWTYASYCTDPKCMISFLNQHRHFIDF